MGQAQRRKDLEDRKGIAQTFGAIFALLGGGSFASSLPVEVSVMAGGLALAGLIAAWRFNVEARAIGLEIAEADDRLERAQRHRMAPVITATELDPTRIGVDAATQNILPGGEIPNYVPRDVDRDLRDAVAAAFSGDGPWLVAVIGPSKVGKSRTLFEAVMHAAQEHELKLVAPVDAVALRTLINSADDETELAPTVLWLDDLEPLLNDGVTLATLRQWHAGGRGRIVVGTYGGRGSERIASTAAGHLTTSASEVLQRAREIPMAETTTQELAALRSHVSDEEFVLMERHGLAAYVVAGPALERKLFTRRHAPGDHDCIEGVAVVLAAVDWARCGRTDPIPVEALRRLWPNYLAAHVAATDDAFDAAIAWAVRPVAGTIALLRTVDGFYQAFDYAVRLVRDGPGSKPPNDLTWLAAVETAEDALALAVATSAYQYARFDFAVGALARARASSVDEVVAQATYNLGVTLKTLERPEEAIAAYDAVVRRFRGATDPELREGVARALLNRGRALGELHGPETEIVAYDDMVVFFGDAAEPEVRERLASALINKGAALVEMNCSEEALVVYDDIIARIATAPEPELQRAVATAMSNKAITLNDLERPADAITVCDDLVARFGDASDLVLRRRVATAVHTKGVSLGMLLRPQDAIAAYDDVVERFDATPVPEMQQPAAMALFNKGVTLNQLQHSVEAIAAYDDVVARFEDTSDPDVVLRIASALFNKAVTLEGLSRPVDAVVVYDEIVARFEDESQPGLREVVERARRARDHACGGD